MSYPRAEPASAEYAYADPKSACYAFGRLPQKYHPLDAWQTMGRQPPSLTRWIFQLACGAAIGFGGVCFQNYQNQRPIYSGVHRHIFWTSVMIALSHSIYVVSLTRAARRDAVIRHYLETHMDDFPVVDRKKVKDILLPWHPIR